MLRLEGIFRNGEMAERFKAAVLKTVERKLRGFESYSHRQFYNFHRTKIISYYYIRAIIQYQKHPPFLSADLLLINYKEKRLQLQHLKKFQFYQ